MDNQFKLHRNFAWVILLGLVSTSRAGVVEVRSVDNGGVNDGQLDLTGTKTFDILLSSGPDELIFPHQIWLRLTQGQIVHHPQGSLQPPSADAITTYPALEFDTFLASGVPNSSFLPLIVPTTSEDLGHPLAVPEVNTSTELDVLYGPLLGLDTTDWSDYLAARITLSDNAVGTLSYQTGFKEGSAEITYSRVDVPVELLIHSPEPASALAAGIGILGMAISVRRRRGS